MGKYVLLITFATALGLAYFTQQSNQTAQATSADQSERQESVIARQIARSAFDEGVSYVKQNFDSLDDDDICDGSLECNGRYEQGTYDLDFETTESGDDMTVTITAEGTFEGSTYQISGTATKKETVSALFNAITANTPITFNVAGGGCSGDACISGFDGGGEDDRFGVTLPAGSDPEPICDEFGDGKVVGRGGGGCDVRARTESHDEWVTQELEQLEFEIQEAEGSEDVTPCDGCKLKDIGDSGILYVTGELTINGSEQWDGLVYVAEEGSVVIKGGGDADNINGGLILDNETEFKREDVDLRGGNSVKYNSDTLDDYMDTIPSIQGSSIEITDRHGRFISNSQ